MLIGSLTQRSTDATNAYDLLTDVCDYMLEEPKRVYMGQWLGTWSDANFNQYVRQSHVHDFADAREKFKTIIEPTIGDGPACGSVGCIGGTIVHLLHRSREYRSVLLSAAEILTGVEREWSIDPYTRDLGTMHGAIYHLFMDDIIIDAPIGSVTYAEIVVTRVRTFQAAWLETLKNVPVAVAAAA
jgi:hypothetical protein